MYLKVIMVSAPWCGNCRKLRPILEKVINERGYDFDILEDGEGPVADDFIKDYGIIMFPSVFVFDENGMYVDDFEGSNKNYTDLNVFFDMCEDMCESDYDDDWDEEDEEKDEEEDWIDDWKYDVYRDEMYEKEREEKEEDEEKER